MTGTDVFILLFIGLLAGTFGGLLGIGGSIVVLPALAILFSDRYPVEYQHIFQATAMFLTVVVNGPAAWWHYKQKGLIREILRWLIPAAFVGILLGVAASNLWVFSGANAIYLRRLLGAFLLYVVAYNAYRLTSKRRLGDMSHDDLAHLGWLKPTAVVGLPMGFFGGLLGIGGGTVCVPLQQIFLKVPLPRAIANSSAAIFFIMIPGAVYKTLSLETPADQLFALKLAAVLVPTCFIGGLIGAKLIYFLPRNAVRVAFCALMLYAGLRLILR